MSDKEIQRVPSFIYTNDQVRKKTQAIYRRILDESKYLDRGNFTCIHPHDLETLFEYYDAEFFAGSMRKMVADVPLSFRLSKRMTKAGGKTTWFKKRDDATARRFEITISTNLLFANFREDERQITINGLVCNDRLESLMRIFEHEMTHLFEMLVWDDSNCSAQRFQTIAKNAFAHTHYKHGLVTAPERARKKYGIGPGSRVTFEFDGDSFSGVVNRITKRATVLVPDRKGALYADGKRYRKFYIPLQMLKPVGGD